MNFVLQVCVFAYFSWNENSWISTIWLF